jgi:hypothetical protein
MVVRGGISDSSLKDRMLYDAMCSFHESFMGDSNVKCLLNLQKKKKKEKNPCLFYIFCFVVEQVLFQFRIHSEGNQVESNLTICFLVMMKRLLVLKGECMNRVLFKSESITLKQSGICEWPPVRRAGGRHLKFRYTKSSKYSRKNPPQLPLVCHAQGLHFCCKV